MCVCVCRKDTYFFLISGSSIAVICDNRPQIRGCNTSYNTFGKAFPGDLAVTGAVGA